MKGTKDCLEKASGQVFLEQNMVRIPLPHLLKFRKCLWHHVFVVETLPPPPLLLTYKKKILLWKFWKKVTYIYLARFCFYRRWNGGWRKGTSPTLYWRRKGLALNTHDIQPIVPRVISNIHPRGNGGSKKRSWWWL